VSVFYTHFSFSCEINELFKCQRIRGQETPNEQLVTTTKRANNKNESSQEKTIKRFFPFYESVPRPSVFFFLRSVSMRIHEIQKAIYQGIVKGNARISFIGL